MHLTATALNNLLADGQTDSSSLFVDILRALDLAIHLEELAELFRVQSRARVRDLYFKHLSDLVVAHYDFDLSFICEFYRVPSQVDQYLL